MTTEGDRLHYITEQIAEEVYQCLKLGMTEEEVLHFLRLMRTAVERGHNTVALPHFPKMKYPG